MPNIEMALTFENPEDGSSIQFEKDTNGYSLTIFNEEGGETYETTMNLDPQSLVRLTNFLVDTINEGVN